MIEKLARAFVATISAEAGKNKLLADDAVQALGIAAGIVIVTATADQKLMASALKSLVIAASGSIQANSARPEGVTLQ